MRSALLSRFDYDYPQMRDSGYLWPIVDLRTKYLRSARFGQRLRVRAELTEWEVRMRIDYLVSDAESGEAITRAHTIQVAVDAATGEFRGEAQPAREGEISATFVAPPVNADAVRQGSAGSADADRGDIEGPRTLAAPDAAPGAAASDDRDASDR